MKARKQILKASLHGIAELHSHDIVHLDIKPDNIMVNYRGTGLETIVEDVQIIDLENAAYLPKGRCIKGMLAGNDSWRSPEAHFKGELNKPSDIFSFAAVMKTYETSKLRACFLTFDEEVNCQVLGMLWDDRTADYHSYRPFSDWPNVTDEKFKDLIRSMTNLDPRKRVTAREALEHPWFSDCEINGVGNRDIQDATSITA
ncbi:Hypothetical protein PENO1_010320 [Penicillium occitanis (nom. inval.)]|nr:Hypothetical protein PENO1_010320 [Penicillium occitanis (nom. inval.)]PCH09869.1 hypothetical protein PENOC_007530 [Penicillium occitanis (nom. inval.)]